MKFIHLSDLHLGKRIKEFSMLEDQRHILQRILEIVDSQEPQALFLAGDIYDKSIPPVEAVELFDDFLAELALRRVQVFVISGNHDSPERLSFGCRLMEASGIHLAPLYSGAVQPHVLQDEFGPVHVYMLPFVKPAHVRRFLPDAPIESYTDAVAAAVGQMQPDPAARSVLITHQFVTGAARCDSEELSVGGTDNVDASVFAGFDYVALGHIHGPQNVGAPHIRYCGTPLKYSFSEASHVKSVTVGELGPKGQLWTNTIPLEPLRDMRCLKGTFAQLTEKSFWALQKCDDYLQITLTDEEEIPNGMARLQAIYPNVMKLDYDNSRRRADEVENGAQAPEQRHPMELFAEFYEKQNGAPLSGEQKEYLSALIERVWEGEVCDR